MSRTLDQLIADLDAIQRGKLKSLASREARRYALRLEGKAKQNATVSPRVRSGRLRSSIKTTVREGSGLIQVRLQAGDPPQVKYARAQELGAVIRAINGRYLAIPLQAARTGAGDLKAEYAGGWRGKPGVFVLRSKGGRLFLAKRQGSDLILLAKLQEQVVLRPRRYLRYAVETETPEFRRRLGDGIRKLLATGKDTAA